MCDEVHEDDLTPAERALARDLDAIAEAQAKVDNLQRQFLQIRGWRYTCDIGSFWLWRKGPLALDASTAITLESHWPDGIPGMPVDEVLRG